MAIKSAKKIARKSAVQRKTKRLASQDVKKNAVQIKIKRLVSQVAKKSVVQVKLAILQQWHQQEQMKCTFVQMHVKQIRKAAHITRTK